MLQDMKDKDAKRVEDGTKSYKKSHDMSESVRVGAIPKDTAGQSASLCISLHLSASLCISL